MKNLIIPTAICLLAAVQGSPATAAPMGEGSRPAIGSCAQAERVNRLVPGQARGMLFATLNERVVR